MTLITVLVNPACVSLLHQDLHARFWPAPLIYCCYTRTSMHGHGQPCLCVVNTPGPSCTVMANPAYLLLLHQDLLARFWPTLLVCRCYTRTFMHGFGQPCLFVAVAPGPPCTAMASPACVSLLHQQKDQPR